MNKQLIQLFIVSIILFMSNNLVAAQQSKLNTDTPISLFVEFQFEAKDMDDAIELLTNMQNKVIEYEEGCIIYDILLNDEEPHTIYLYECYENKTALEAHNNTSYFKDIVEKQLAPLIKTQKIIRLYPINDVGTLM